VPADSPIGHYALVRFSDWRLRTRTRSSDSKRNDRWPTRAPKWSARDHFAACVEPTTTRHRADRLATPLAPSALALAARARHCALMGDGEPSSTPASSVASPRQIGWGGPFTSHRAARLYIAASAFIVAGVVLATTVLWVRQTPDALLRVRSFPGGAAEVAFWALPTFIVYMAIARSRVWVMTGGVAVIVMLCLGWWSYATDWHSTASLGPAGTGWFLGPAMLAAPWIITRQLRRRHQSR